MALPYHLNAHYCQKVTFSIILLLQQPNVEQNKTTNTEHNTVEKNYCLQGLANSYIYYTF